MMFRGVLAALLTAQSGADNLKGSYEGQVPFIIDINCDFDGSTKAHIDVDVKVAGKRINCETEDIAETDSQVTFPNSGNDGDCLGDGVRSDSKNPSKYLINKNSDGSLIFKSDGYPDLKLTQRTSLGEKLEDHGEVFLAGFLEGFLGEAEHIKACIGGSAKAAKDARQLFADLKSRNLNKTVADVQALVMDVMVDSKACKDAPKDLAPFLAAFKGVHSIKDLLTKVEDNFLAHDRQILDVLEDMIDVCTISKPDAKKCGEDAGKEMRSLVIGDRSVSAELEDHGKVFLAGFLEGFLGDSEHIKACVSGSVKAAQDVGNLVADLKSKNLNKTVADVEALFTDVMADVQACKDIGKDLQALMAAFKDVHSIKDLMNALKENFLAHDREVLDVLEDMIEVCTISKPDAKQCGVDAGKEVRSILVGDSVVV